MVAPMCVRGSNSTCQQLFVLFYILSTIIISAHADSDAKHSVKLIPRQDDGTYEDPQWVEGDGSEDDPTDGTAVYPTTTDYYQDPSTETNYNDNTATDTYYVDPATETNWDDPTATESNWADTTTESYWEDPATTTNNWQDTTTTDDWQDTRTESYWEQTARYSEEATSTEAAAVVPTTTTTTEQTVAAETTQQDSSSTQEQPTPATTTTESFSITSSTATPSLVLGSNECAEDATAVGGTCPYDYFCNAATKHCDALSDNGGQCYEDFQCQSSYCDDNSTCGNRPNESGAAAAANLSGGQIAGVTIGSVAGAVVLVGALMMCQKRRSRQVSTRARKFEQIRTEDAEDDLETAAVMRDTDHGDNRTSKYNFLASLMTGTAVGRSLSRLGNNRSMESQAYLHGGSQPAMSERSLQPPPLSSSSATAGMTAATGAGGLAVATYNNNNNRESKVEEQPVDPATFEDQQYYGNLTIGPSSPTHTIADNHDNNGAQAGQQEQYDPYRPNPHASWLSQASAIDPFGTAAAYNYATQPHQASAAASSVERPPTTVIRESTYNNLHAPIFHVSAPPEDNTVPAGGGAYVPALAPTIHDQSRQSPEMDAFGGNGGGGDGSKRGSWLLKEIAARWQQGSATGARASGITATTDASSVNNDSSTSNTTDESKQQRPQHIQTDSDDNSNNNKGRTLWDDALASAGGSTVARSASTASTNPFRSSMSNPRDSVISALRIPPIQEDAWSLEDHAAMSSDDNPVATTKGENNNNNDTSLTMQQQHHP